MRRTPQHLKGLKLRGNSPKKFPEIPTLSSYGAGATKIFWEKFPSNPIPATPETRIDITALKTIFEECKKFLLKSEQKRAEKCINYLVMGGPAFQITPLGSCHVKNSKAAIQHGEEVTDTIAAWITKKICCRPFRYSASTKLLGELWIIMRVFYE
jgi:hypothetical protein